jgi:tripartite-type tricarboxylate transporter receptor subunit TctC
MERPPVVIRFELMMRGLAAFIITAITTTAASAQSWPTRPVTMIVPYAAGGPVDTVGRIMAQALTEELGQQVIIENIGGAGGMTGANRVAKGTPDGYTFLLGGSATMTTVPALNGKKTSTIRSRTSSTSSSSPTRRAS